jgi:hypothetical protein
MFSGPFYGGKVRDSSRIQGARTVSARVRGIKAMAGIRRTGSGNRRVTARGKLTPASRARALNVSFARLSTIIDGTNPGVVLYYNERANSASCSVPEIPPSLLPVFKDDAPS